MSIHPYFESCDLTSDVGVSVFVYSHAKYAVAISAGGDMSVSIGSITPGRARELARLLNEAAEVAEREELPSWLKETQP